MKIPTKRHIGLVALIIVIVGSSGLLIAPHLVGWSRPKPPVDAKIAEPRLKPGYYPMESLEEKRINQILGESRFTITIGYDGVSYREPSNYINGVNMADLTALLEKAQERKMAIIHEEINFEPETNDKEERDIIELLQAQHFRTIVITRGTGNRGGTIIDRIVGDCGP